jgi:monofunctional biosynthetic peptidoglycan transglycosylase
MNEPRFLELQPFFVRNVVEFIFHILVSCHCELERNEWRSNLEIKKRRLPPDGRNALRAAEDQKFADHFGFDLQSIQESVLQYREGAALRGASTITQQVAKNLYLWPGRNFLRKGVEAWFALLIELTWPKRRILEVYLNVAEFGPGLYGVPAASRVYFGKPASEISDAEAALLAAVLPNPHRLDVARPSPYVRERQGWILRHMQRLRREGWLQAL